MMASFYFLAFSSQLFFLHGRRHSYLFNVYQMFLRVQGPRYLDIFSFIVLDLLLTVQQVFLIAGFQDASISIGDNCPHVDFYGGPIYPRFGFRWRKGRRSSRGRGLPGPGPWDLSVGKAGFLAPIDWAVSLIAERECIMRPHAFSWSVPPGTRQRDLKMQE